MRRDIVVIGGSAGALEAIMSILAALPKNFRGSVLVVIHTSPDAPNLLPKIFSRYTELPVSQAKDGGRFEPGNVYVSIPDHHLLIENGRMQNVRGPKENRHRPSVDVLFRSAAVAFGRRTIGVVVSGALDDGTAGLHAIKQCGGIAVVQDPVDAMFPGMPSSAIAHVDVDYCIPAEEIGQTLVKLTNAEIRGDDLPIPPLMEFETRIARMERDAMEEDQRPGQPSAFSCPECHGVLWELNDDELVRFRCRVGHAYSPDTMLSAQSEVLEAALWSALKTLEESERMSKRLAEQERARGHLWMATRFEEKVKETNERAEVIRQVLQREETSLPLHEEESQREAGRSGRLPATSGDAPQR